MYRIRTASGGELNFNSLEEFTAAVRRGDVHPEDEIFHTRANRWLDVKSHPHYRSALSASSPKPATPVTPSPAGPSSQTRAQVFERPVVKPPQQQTVLRPQLKPASPAPGTDTATKPDAPVRYGPPPKTKELQFLDLGTSDQRQKAAVIEAEKPPVVQRPEAKAPVKPDSKPGVPGTEVEFLVMDTGLESPVRTSAGHMTVPEDLHLLFDAPLPDPEAKQASQSDAATSEVGSEAGTASAAGGKSPVLAPSAPAAAASAPSGKRPALAAPLPTPAAAEDLDIPAGPLLEAPVPAPELTQTPSKLAALDSRKGIIAGGVALIAVIGALLAWRPWHGAPATDDVAAQTGPAASATTRPPVTPAPQAPPPDQPAKAVSKTVASAPPVPGRPADPPATSTASTDTQEGDGVVAAVKPRFRPDAGLATANLSLDADLPSGTAAAAVAPSELARRYTAAGKEAQQELVNRLANVGYRAVLTASRLSSAAGVAQARSAWTSGSDALRQYRARVARLEKAYEDSALTSQRSQRWSGEDLARWTARQTLTDPAEVAQLTDLMFSQVGEGLDLLAALAGEYTVKGDVITFKNPTSATRYVGIQNWVGQRITAWSATPEGARPYTVSAILAALGGGFPTPK